MRTLRPEQQALLVWAHLHDNVTCTSLATGFGVGVATVHRDVRESCTVLAAAAPTVDTALGAAREKAYLVLYETLGQTDRVRSRPKGADRDHHCGKIGGTARTSAGRRGQARGELVCCSDALPGSRHDIRCAKEHAIPQALAPFTAAVLGVLADKGASVWAPGSAPPSCGPTLALAGTCSHLADQHRVK